MIRFSKKNRNLLIVGTVTFFLISKLTQPSRSSQILREKKAYSEGIIYKGASVMAMNRIQFQKGLSMPDFIKQFGTENQCENALEQARWATGFVSGSA